MAKKKPAAKAAPDAPLRVTPALTPQKIRVRLEELAGRIDDAWANRNELIEISRLFAHVEEQVALTADRDEQRTGRAERWRIAAEKNAEAAEQRKNAFLRHGGHLSIADDEEVVDVVGGDDDLEKYVEPVETGETVSSIMMDDPVIGDDGELAPPELVPTPDR